MIVSTRGRSAQEDFTYKSHGQAAWQMPLVVLIDQDSASAAEIFAGAIRDHHRGTLVGVRSFGKGSVQGIFPLESSEAGLRLTTAKFYSPNGHPYAGVGVEPDVLVHQAARPIDGALPAAAANRDDAMINAALEVARTAARSNKDSEAPLAASSLPRPRLPCQIVSAGGITARIDRRRKHGCVVSVAGRVVDRCAPCQNLAILRMVGHRCARSALQISPWQRASIC